MCFYLTVSLTSPVFHFSFPLQMILTWWTRFIHTFFHMLLSFPITLFNWLKSSQGGFLTVVLSESSKPPNYFLVSSLKLHPTAVDSLLPFAVVCSTLLAFLQKKDLEELPPGSFGSPCKWKHHSIASAGMRISHCHILIFHCAKPQSSILYWGPEVGF